MISSHQASSSSLSVKREFGRASTVVVTQADSIGTAGTRSIPALDSVWLSLTSW